MLEMWFCNLHHLLSLFPAPFAAMNISDGFIVDAFFNRAPHTSDALLSFKSIHSPSSFQKACEAIGDAINKAEDIKMGRRTLLPNFFPEATMDNLFTPADLLDLLARNESDKSKTQSITTVSRI